MSDFDATDEVRELQAEVARLTAENARLREAIETLLCCGGLGERLTGELREALKGGG